MIIYHLHKHDIVLKSPNPYRIFRMCVWRGETGGGILELAGHKKVWISNELPLWVYCHDMFASLFFLWRDLIFKERKISRQKEWIPHFMNNEYRAKILKLYIWLTRWSRYCPTYSVVIKQESKTKSIFETMPRLIS